MPKPPRTRTVDEVIEELPSEFRPIAESLRDVIRATAPQLRERVRWGAPSWVGRTDVLCLMVYPRWVHLGLFHGAELAGRFPQIAGTGKAMRHVLVPTTQDAHSPTIRRIIRAAVELDATRP